MLYHVLAVLLGGLSLAESFHVDPIRRMSVAKPRLRMASVDRPSSPPTAVSSAVVHLGKEETFNWNKQWYPVLFVEHTDPGRAQPVQILGKDLVLWRGKDKRWTCFDDRCPHRAAPLTEGRVEDDGSILCAYHAWRFDADGKCLSIPQSDSGGRDEAQPKACAKVYPTQVAQGVIWVWGENGPDAALESALTPPALVPELEDKELLESGKIINGGGTHNDLAYGWDTFMENVVDSSHAPSAHHGIAGDRYDDVGPLHLELDENWPATPARGFRFNFRDQPPGTSSACIFVPPTLVINETDDPAGGTVKLFLYATPSRPGWCRILTRYIYVHRHAPKSKEAKELIMENKRLGRKPWALATALAVSSKLPAWIEHPLGNLFLYQDLVFLHHQEKILASAGYDSSTYSQAVYVPATSDRAVMALRQWITKFGSGGPTWDKGCDPTLPPRERNREALFNVYENHTKNCSTCRGALKNIEKTLAAAKVSAVVSFAWAILRGARATAIAASLSDPVLNTTTVRAMLPALALMLASLGATKAIQQFHDLFYVYSFHHQDNP